METTPTFNELVTFYKDTKHLNIAITFPDFWKPLSKYYRNNLYLGRGIYMGRFNYKPVEISRCGEYCYLDTRAYAETALKFLKGNPELVPEDQRYLLDNSNVIEVWESFTVV